MTHSCSCSPDISSPMLSLPGPFSGRSLDSWGSSMLAPSGNSKWWPPRGEWIDLGTSGHCGRGHTRFCAFLLVHIHIKKYIVLPFNMHICCVYIYVCMYACMYVYTCVFIYICVCMCVLHKNNQKICVYYVYVYMYSYTSETDEHTIIYILIYCT